MARKNARVDVVMVAGGVEVLDVTVQDDGMVSCGSLAWDDVDIQASDFVLALRVFANEIESAVLDLRGK